jgi:flagellar M-ring protein FliF
MAVNRPDFMNQLQEMWGRLEWRQRTTIIAFAALGLILIVSVVYLMNRVEYQTLYRDLNPEDAQAIVSRLEESRRNFRVKGTSILVAAPKEDIDKMRLEFSGAGLGRSGLIGYEIFDKSQFGMTDFTEQINLQRALQGELERTISRLSEVSTARVHITLPKDSYFEESRERAKASVFLTLKSGTALSKSSIAGIRGVVAGAVPGLTVQNVSIVDDEGRVLAQSAESGDITRSDLEIELGLRDQLEKDLAAKAAAILEPVAGRKNVQVSASVEIDTNMSQQTEELFNQNPQAVVSHQRIEERAGGNLLDMGIPGTQSNVGTAEASSSILTGPERFRESETTNYEVSKTVRHTTQPKGSIRRLSVAVTLNNKTVVTKAQDGTVTTRMEPYSENELAAYRELVMAAVGYNELRGDVVTLRSALFYDDTALRENAPGPWYVRVQRQEYFIPAIKYGALLLVFLLAYLIFIRPVRNRVFQAIDSTAPALPPAEENLLLESGATPAEALPGAEAIEESEAVGLPEMRFEPEIEAFDMENATEEQIEDMLTSEEMALGRDSRRYAVIKKKMIDKARRNPELVSQLIRSLMQEKA